MRCRPLPTLRHPFQTQPDLQINPIEKLRLPLQCRDELPPILAGKEAPGRTGMDFWPILVLGVVRLGLDADWDRMEDLANQHLLVRQRLGVPVGAWGQDAKVFGHQTLRDNIALLDDPPRNRKPSPTETGPLALENVGGFDSDRRKNRS